MAHMLDFTRGNAAIAYRGDVPWHGYGETIDANDTLESMMKKASIDFDILELDAFYPYNGEMLKVPNRKTLVRSDNGKWFSHMSENRYEVRQPKQIVEFFRDLCDHGGYEIETLGALYEGAQVWCLAKRKDHTANLGDDIINPYILLAESYNGTLATTAQATSVRVVCNNTLSYSVGQKGNKLKIGHNQKFDENKVKDELAKVDAGFDAYWASLKAFSSVKMTPEFKARFFTKLFGSQTTEAKKDEKPIFIGAQTDNAWKKAKIDYDALSTNSANVIDRLLNLSQAGNSPGANFFEGTLYNALQTTTYYIDHEIRTKGDQRFLSATFGGGADKKQEALELAMSLIK